MNAPKTSYESDILIVDDDKMQNFVMTLQVQLAGYLVRSARTGVEALTMIYQRLPEVLIMEIGLPDLTGQEIVAELRKNVLTNSIPVIVHTNFELSQKDKALMWLGPTMFITKEVAFSERFSELIIEILEQASKNGIGEHP